jgi:hypothetical protein
LVEIHVKLQRLLLRTKSLFGEFVVIVAGVLAALAVDQWRDALEARQLESAYIERLRADLASDTASFAEFERTFVAAKVSVLEDLLADDAVVRLGRRPDLLSDLSYSSFKALPPHRPATFEELESTGRLSLLSDLGLRGALSSYYSGFEHISRVLAEPDGDYQVRLWRFLPGVQVYRWRMFGEQPSREDLIAGVERLLLEPDLEGAVNSELEYTAGMAFYLSEYRREAANLLSLLEES